MRLVFLMGADLILAVVSIDAGREPNWEAAVRKAKDDIEAVAVVEELRDAWNGQRRDGTKVMVRDARVLIVGGMSWGDSPGPSFDALLKADEFGLLEAAGFDPPVSNAMRIEL